MKKFFKILLSVLVGLGVALGALLTWVKFALPNLGSSSEVKIEADSALLARGAYLANSVAVCMDCHSTRDWSKFSGPLTPGTLGKGGEAFTKDFGFPGNIYSKNISPAALSSWTDTEVYRAITMGVSKDNTPLFPVMPYHNYGKLANADVYAIVAYLRTLKPIENSIPERTLDFPMNFIVHSIPKKNEPAAAVPDTSNALLYGAYITNAAACIECHTKQEKGEKLPGMDFAGGFEFKMKGFSVSSPNITPDVETGIGKWTKEQFIARFKAFSGDPQQQASVKPGEFNTVMPWTMYANMTERDLAAIYDYLRSIQPVSNKVEVFKKL